MTERAEAEGASQGAAADRLTPPDRLNLAIAAAILCASLGLLWLGSQLDLAWALVVGIPFSFVLLSNYALMHEAVHDVLHRNPRTNWLIGMVAGWLFPMSFTVLKVTHIVHHCCNRTDHEMFDYYYPGDRLPIKYAQWYGLLLGLWWPLIPVGTLLLGIAPGLLRSMPFRRARTTAVLFDDFGPAEVFRIRLEVATGLVFWTAAFLLLDLRWEAVLLMYACFGFNWSTRQYVTHAFTPRDVRNGALNLRVSRLMGAVLLNGHWDLVHHRHPHVPWTHLPVLGRDSEPPVSYWHQYRELWKGPRPSPGSGPEILPKGAYRAM